MKCKSCGAELPEGETICPECGSAVKKGMPLGLKIGLCALIAIIIIGGFLIVYKTTHRSDSSTSIAQTNPTDNSGLDESSDTSSDSTADTSDLAGNSTGSDTAAVTAGVSYTVASDAVTDEQLDTVVATYGDHTLTNRELAYYYWYGYTSFCSYYSSYIDQILDTSTPLDEQIYDSSTGETWQEYFLEYALNNFANYSALCDAAEAAGYELESSFTEYLDSIPDSFAGYASDDGFEDGDAYAQYVFGPGSSVEGYQAFMTTYMTQRGYCSELYSSIAPTDEEVEAYYDENAETYESDGVTKDDTHLVNVRHILIQPDDTDDDASWTSAETRANTIYEQWKSGEATEDSFAELAETWSSDTGSSSNGGLYENIYPGQMVTEFNDWCFDSSRQPGDTGIVKTSYGYHIMYFSSVSDDLYWQYEARNDLISQTYSDEITAIESTSELTTDYDSVILVTPSGMGG